MGALRPASLFLILCAVPRQSCLLMLVVTTTMLMEAAGVRAHLHLAASPGSAPHLLSYTSSSLCRLDHPR